MIGSLVSDLRLDVQVDGERVHVLTRGLAALDRPELVVADVPPLWRSHAEALVTRIAELCVDTPGSAGQVLHFDTLVGQVVVRFEPWPSDPQRLMLVDLADVDEGCPFIALATMWGRAASQLLHGDRDGAVAMLREAIGAQPVLGEGEPDIVLQYNWDGAMNLLLLGALENDPALVREAFSRSPQTELRTLGDPIDALLDLDADLLEHAAAILVTSQFTNLAPIAGAEEAVFTGPLAVREGPMLVLDRSVVSLEAYMELTSAAVMDVLFDAATHRLAAQVVVSRPPMLLWLEMAAVRDLHLERPECIHANTGWIEGMRLVSYVLGDIARLLAGGASFEDLSAWYGLTDDADATARVAEAAGRFTA